MTLFLRKILRFFAFFLFYIYIRSAEIALKYAEGAGKTVVLLFEAHLEIGYTVFSQNVCKYPLVILPRDGAVDCFVFCIKHKLLPFLATGEVGAQRKQYGVFVSSAQRL